MNSNAYWWPCGRHSMFSVADDAPVYLRTGPTDMRKSINGLSALVQYEMKKNPFAPGYYLFCSRSRKLMKVLYWDRTGFALWYLCEASHKYHYVESHVM